MAWLKLSARSLSDTLEIDLTLTRRITENKLPLRTIILRPPKGASARQLKIDDGYGHEPAWNYTATTDEIVINLGSGLGNAGDALRFRLSWRENISPVFSSETEGETMKEVSDRH
jgi:hypothetical protein